jgi:uncharacterized LabA/DUF88 family protein
LIPARCIGLRSYTRAGVLLGRGVRTIVFFDGQNLYRGAKDAWRPQPAIGFSRYSWPSYDVEKLAEILTYRIPGRTLAQICFYTGVPKLEENEHWHYFWSNKLRYLKNRGVETYKGRINLAGQEKGVDVRLAIDLVRLTYEEKYEVAIIVSQDWDFGEAIRLAKKIAKNQGRELVFESSFPLGTGSKSDRGIPGTNWFPIEQTTYDACYDPREYRKL